MQVIQCCVYWFERVCDLCFHCLHPCNNCSPDKNPPAVCPLGWKYTYIHTQTSKEELFMALYFIYFFNSLFIYFYDINLFIIYIYFYILLLHWSLTWYRLSLPFPQSYRSPPACFRIHLKNTGCKKETVCFYTQLVTLSSHSNDAS